MICTYTCSNCKSGLFTGNLKLLLARRRKDAPEYIEMICPYCDHLNRLTYDQSTELRKAQPPQSPTPSGDTVE